MLRQRLIKAVLLALAAGSAAWALHKLQIALAVVMMFCAALLLVTLVMPHVGAAVLEQLLLWARTAHWREEQGRHHAFAGVPLHIVDDGRFCWVAGHDLQQVMGTRDPEDVLAARLSGRWRRDDRNRLLLRVDAVVDFLAAAPGRADPRTVHLRRYFEREVLFPAATRRQRSQAG